MKREARVSVFFGVACVAVALGSTACHAPADERLQRASTRAAQPPSLPDEAAARERVAGALPASWRFQLGKEPARARRFMVVSDSALATQVGVDVLGAAGNAADAAVAVAFALAVVYPEAGSLGGGGFAVVRGSDGALAALDFREKAPARARRNMFAERPESSRIGHLAAGVPGTVAGLHAVHRRFGSKPWRELVLPAQRLAERGFALEPSVARSLSESREKLERFPASKALFFPNGEAPRAGDIATNPDLARVLLRVAEEGPRGFYAGPTAALVVEEMQRAGGLVDAEDLAAYDARWRTPIQFEYRGHTVVSMPPPSSGGVALALIANVLERYPLPSLGFHGVEHVHLTAKAMRRAFADRNGLIGDPDFVSIPLTALLSDEYGAARQKTIGARATPSSEIRPGIARSEGVHTTHFAVVDAAGGAVALTTTLNESFGSGVTVTGAGFLLNDEMDDFTTRPGIPNAYGLVQGEANAIAPGKRMLSSMAPTLVLGRNGEVEVVAGARGGPRIITATWQVISNVLDFGLSAVDAVSAPRIHHQWLPDELVFEADGLDPTTREGLESVGHALRADSDIGNAPVIVRDARGWSGAFDPRRGGLAAGQ